MAVTKRGLNKRQKVFVDEYLKDLNATQAAIRAGYNKKTARFMGSENLTKPNITDAISKAMADRSARTQITTDMVLKELALIGFSNIKAFVKWDGEGTRFYPSDELTDEQAAPIAEVSSKKTSRKTEDGSEIENVEIKIKLYDKQAALVNIGKHLGMFLDKSPIRTDEAIEFQVIE